MKQYRFVPVLFDITKTGLHLWIAVYFRIETESLAVHDLSDAVKAINDFVPQKCRYFVKHDDEILII